MDPAKKQESHHYRALEAQLVIGLKFHFPDTLKNVPLEVALRAMEKVWVSCQDKKGFKDDDSQDDGDKVIYL